MNHHYYFLARPRRFGKSLLVSTFKELFAGNRKLFRGLCRMVLRDFFGVIKDLDEYLQFVFLTGVSKFAKTSIFSGLNNLEDITLSDQAATLLGYTQEELRLYFEPYIKKLATLKRNSIENIISDMKLWYNGYQFTEDTNAKVYNKVTLRQDRSYTFMVFLQPMYTIF